MKLIGLRIYLLTIKYNMFSKVLDIWDKVFSRFVALNEKYWIKLWDHQTALYARRETLHIQQASKHLKLEDYESFDDIKEDI